MYKKKSNNDIPILVIKKENVIFEQEMGFLPSNFPISSIFSTPSFKCILCLAVFYVCMCVCAIFTVFLVNVAHKERSSGQAPVAPSALVEDIKKSRF